MAKKHYSRFYGIVGALLCMSLAVSCILYALNSNINLFYAPVELLGAESLPNTKIRLGGMVVKGSVERGDDLFVKFQLTDYEKTITVHYTGLLPDLFREGQGIVTKGKLDSASKIFIASEVLAKHDENYMPKEVRDALAKRKA